MKLLLISGATRPGNMTNRAVKLVCDYIKSKYPNVDLTLVSPADYKLEYDDKNQNPDYINLVNDSTAFIIITPEYNHGYPGKLKSLLDCAFNEYKGKPVLLGGVSDGPFGGARAIENLSPVMKCLSLVMSKNDLIFPNINKIIDENGNSLDPQHYERVTKTIDEFIIRAN